MKISKSHIELGMSIAVYLFALYMWTLPFQNNQAPYGEFDAISHFELGSYIAQKDRTFVYLPPFLDYSYGNDNKFKPHTLWYHPPFHTSLAIISAFARGKVVPIFLTNAIFASSILISIFFVIRKLYGFMPAILSSFILIFSMRDILPYLWGQWPERFAYAFVPLILYCFYAYYTTYSKEKSKPIYLYIMSLLLAIDMLIHPLIFFHSLAGIFVLGIALFIKDRKLALNLRHLGIALLLFLILFAIFPYQTGNVIKSFTKGSSESTKPFSVSRLLQWAPNPEDFKGSVPASYFSFKEMHGLWTLPFLLIGIAVLAVRRERRDIFMLAWLISLYIVLHRDLFGKATFLHRSLSASAHIFVPITVIGALSLASLVKSPKIRPFLKYGLAALIVVLALIYSMPAAYSTLAKAYDSPLIRLNQAQIEVSEWLKSRLNENENVSIIGPLPEILQKVWWMASYSHRTSFFFQGFLEWKPFEKNREEVVKYHLLNDYIVVDYSDISLLSDKKLVEQWQSFERNYLANHTLLYNKNSIKVYKYET